jgi:copper(I)-binding protein
MKSAKSFAAKPFKALLALSMLCIAAQASAQTVVTDAWVRATVPGQPSTGAFMTVTADTDSKLLGAQSPAAKTVQIHQSSMANDVMSMKEVASVELPAGKPVSMDSNSYHVMLIDLQKQVKEGDQVPISLTVEDAAGAKQTIEVQATARALTAPDHGAMHDHSKMH